MILTRIQDALDMRRARCPICQTKFEETHVERKTKKAKSVAARAAQTAGRVQEFVIKKRTITLKIEQPKIHFSLSTVNDSVRMKCDKIEDVWQDRGISIYCVNNRHRYAMNIAFEINRFRMETKNYRLMTETFFFNDSGKRYELRLDYVTERSKIYDPGNGAIHKDKPSILEITDKKDLIQKIDRLFNFE